MLSSLPPHPATVLTRHSGKLGKPPPALPSLQLGCPPAGSWDHEVSRSRKPYQSHLHGEQQESSLLGNTYLLQPR